jgi:hypothetical protein
MHFFNGTNNHRGVGWSSKDELRYPRQNLMQLYRRPSIEDGRRISDCADRSGKHPGDWPYRARVFFWGEPHNWCEADNTP